MTDDALTRRILVCCHLVHRTLGPGYPESTYQRAVTRELEKTGLPFQRDVFLPVMYDGEEIDRIQANFVVNGMVVNFGTETVQTKHISLTPMM